ncbi:hypothetical protein D3C72_1125350 [compost metagenome]
MVDQPRCQPAPGQRGAEQQRQAHADTDDAAEADQHQRRIKREGQALEHRRGCPARYRPDEPVNPLHQPRQQRGAAQHLYPHHGFVAVAVDLLQCLQGRHALRELQAMVIEQGGAQIPGDPDAQEAHGEYPGHHRQRVQLVTGEQGIGGDRRDQPARNDGRGGRGHGLVDVAFVQRPCGPALAAPRQALPQGEADQQGDDRHVERPADPKARVHIRGCQQNAQHYAGEHRPQAQFTFDASLGKGGGRGISHGNPLSEW